MKVCFYRPFSYPLFDPSAPGQFGGAEVRAVTLAKGLAQQGNCQVAFIVDSDHCRPSRDFGEIEVHFQSPHGRNGRATDRPGVSSALQGMSARLLRSVRKRLRYPQSESLSLLSNINADVYCCFGATEASVDIVRAASRLKAQTVLFLVWDKELARDCVPSIVVGKQRRRIQRARDEVLHSADQIVVQTEAQQQRLWRRFSRQASWIRNPIDLQIPTASAGKQPGRYALWVGRADTFHKRPDRCFELARRCAQVPFMLVMNRANYAGYAQLLEQAPANVSIVEQVPYPQMDEYFARARVLVNTSDVEGFPNTFLQAAKHGLPILSYAMDPDGVLETHGCGLLAHASLDAMGNQLERIWGGGAEIEVMSRNARDYVATHHNLVDKVRELEVVLGLGSTTNLPAVHAA